MSAWSLHTVWHPTLFELSYVIEGADPSQVEGKVAKPGNFSAKVCERDFGRKLYTDAEHTAPVDPGLSLPESDTQERRRACCDDSSVTFPVMSCFWPSRVADPVAPGLFHHRP
jgi:hypothetical protein